MAASITGSADQEVAPGRRRPGRPARGAAPPRRSRPPRTPGPGSQPMPSQPTVEREPGPLRAGDRVQGHQFAGLGQQVHPAGLDGEHPGRAQVGRAATAPCRVRADRPPTTPPSVADGLLAGQRRRRRRPARARPSARRRRPASPGRRVARPGWCAARGSRDRPVTAADRGHHEPVAGRPAVASGSRTTPVAASRNSTAAGPRAGVQSDQLPGGGGAHVGAAAAGHRRPATVPARRPGRTPRGLRVAGGHQHRPAVGEVGRGRARAGPRRWPPRCAGPPAVAPGGTGPSARQAPDR